jgi:hypothetical protein
MDPTPAASRPQQVVGHEHDDGAGGRCHHGKANCRRSVLGTPPRSKFPYHNPVQAEFQVAAGAARGHILAGGGAAGVPARIGSAQLAHPSLDLGGQLPGW